MDSHEPSRVGTRSNRFQPAYFWLVAGAALPCILLAHHFILSQRSETTVTRVIRGKPNVHTPISPARPGPGAPVVSQVSRQSPARTAGPSRSAASPSTIASSHALPCYKPDAGPLAFGELLGHWESESKDAEWSSNVEGFFTAMLDAENVSRDMLRGVDCREALCRVDLATFDTGALWRLEATLRQQDHYPYERTIVHVDGSSIVQVLIARDGLGERLFRQY